MSKLTPKRNPEATKEEAKALTKQVQEKTRTIERSWWELAKLVDKCLHKHVPSVLGLTAAAWMEKYLQGSVSDAFRKLRIARGLAGVPEAKLLEMPERNAYQLVRLPEKQRKSPEWVNRAIEQPTAEFKEAVEVAIEKKTGQVREKWVTFAVRLPEAVNEHFELAITELARAESLDIQQKPALKIQCMDLIAALVILEMQGRQ
jgi:hypothetical protein